jgi:hypothetical protein
VVHIVTTGGTYSDHWALKGKDRLAVEEQMSYKMDINDSLQKYKADPAHTKKAYGGSCYRAPIILNLGTTRE